MHLHRSQWLDLFGAVLTALCVVHCLALPVVAVVMPFLMNDVVDAWLGVVLVAVASGAVLWGALTHRQWWPMAPFIAGLALFFASHTAVDEHSPAGVMFAVVGSALILFAHWLNFRAARSFGSCTIHAHSA